MIKEIPGYKGYYASDNGEIFSTRMNGEFRRLSQRLHQGYPRVNLQNNERPSKRCAVPVHQLVLETFIGKKPDGCVCRHLNGNRQDNRLCNLSWGTPRENARDAMRHGTAVCLRHGERAIAAKLTLSDVLTIRRLYATGDYSQKALAEMYHVCQRHVSDIVRGETWTKDLQETPGA